METIARLIVNRSVSRAECLASMCFCFLPLQIRKFFCSAIVLGIFALVFSIAFQTPTVALWTLPVVGCAISGTLRLNRRAVGYAVMTSGLCTSVWLMLGISFYNQRELVVAGCAKTLCKLLTARGYPTSASIGNYTCVQQGIFEQQLSLDRASGQSRDLQCSNLVSYYGNFMIVCLIIMILLCITCLNGMMVPHDGYDFQDRRHYGNWFTSVVNTTTIQPVHGPMNRRVSATGMLNASRRDEADPMLDGGASRVVPLTYVTVMQPDGEVDSLVIRSGDPAKTTEKPLQPASDMITVMQVARVMRNAASPGLVQGVLVSAAASARSDRSGTWHRSKEELVRIASAFRSEKPRLWTPEVETAYIELLEAIGIPPSHTPAVAHSVSF